MKTFWGVLFGIILGALIMYHIIINTATTTIEDNSIVLTIFDHDFIYKDGQIDYVRYHKKQLQ